MSQARVQLHAGGPLSSSAKAALAAFFGERRKVAFLTAASLNNEESYFERVRQALEPAQPQGAGLSLLHLRWDRQPLETLGRAEALFVGGGNTYALLQRLQSSGLLDAVRDKVRAGLPYAGSSAGSNVAGPNILTTNDWNVVGLSRFDALGLVPFNINPHYKEADPAMARFSETRDDRIAEYHAVRANPVLGIEEGSWVEAESGRAEILGLSRAKFFRRGQAPQWLKSGEALPLPPWP
ncbi:MAG: dipeptidase PepE [Elusimicrobia bacterium]|nr:dipeptidase PepE [Elusimicrobiota bacterium]MDE2314209.1 dipeptidase PepE [Elusimicrobiota bacterium]